jgi:hypothetical protein
MEFVQLDALTIWGAQHRERGADVLESNEIPDFRSLDSRLAFQLEPEFNEEAFYGFEILDDDEDVVPSA